MSDEFARKKVKPAHLGASIPDPSHPGMDLAQDGTWVAWDAYWIARLNRGEILIVDDASSANAVSPTFKVGDVVQWTSAGVDQFAAPRTVTAIVDATHVQVEGSSTGIPVNELHIAASPAA